MILFNILESEDSYEDLQSIISKVRKYSQQLIHFCLIYPPLTTYALPTSFNYIAVSVGLIWFRIYLFFFSLSVVFSVYFLSFTD